ncbi:muscarinic acetylcholine receptor M1-like [Conger conger]|uniref:muscarinic acetylcholine receptor M1-like n=1 Tax=Conger conger TaxID=82655 RepID=UPI002A5A1576|nr:muscarinic acetylcholine receptor M1-like [Conger conger]
MELEVMNTTKNTDTIKLYPLGGHSVLEIVVIILITGPLSLVTIIGNLLVMISFRVNCHLRTVNNYFLLSLAVADLILGAISMNLYTTYIIMGRWILGNLACDIWLAIDYVASNASVMNLLVISFDRFFTVTRPLTYNAKRTPRRAAIMIGLAWAISFVLWAPAILFWQYVVGKRTVPKDQCSIQFLSQPIITFGTAIAAFYMPVTIMIILYWRVYRETENRTRELAGLLGSPGGHVGSSQGSGQQSVPSRSPKSSSSSGEAVAVSGSERRAWPLCDCFALRHKVPRLMRRRGPEKRSYLEANSNGSWNVEEEDDDSSSSSFTGEEPDPDEREMGATVTPARPLTQVTGAHREAQEGPGGSGTSRAKDSRSSQSGSQSSFGRSKQSPPSTPNRPKSKKRRSTSLIKEKKAAKTLSAILLAFIVTWTPYNIMVLVSTFCHHCVPDKLWQLGYWLCYVNSTVNPMCYALCNESFRVTFKMLLLCRWDKRKWRRPHHRVPPSHRPHKSTTNDTNSPASNDTNV